VLPGGFAVIRNVFFAAALVVSAVQMSWAGFTTQDEPFTPNAVAEAVLVMESQPPMGHPRLFKGQADYADIVHATRSQRLVGMNAMKSYLRRNAFASQQERPVAGSSPGNEREKLVSWFTKERQLEGMAEAALAWYATKEASYLSEMRERMHHFGNRIIASHCDGDLMQARAHAWYFALAYDFSYAALDSAERQMVRDVIVSCARSSLGALPEKIQANPRDGIAFHSLGKFLGALLVISGEEPSVRLWLTKVAATYISHLSPWGGSDGGYSNGTSYLLWDVGDSLLVWDLIDRVLHVPIYTKPWISELPRFVAYTLPPGTPAGLFGDGAEVKRTEEWGRLGRAIMSRFHTPLARWYAAQLPEGDPARLHLLLSPVVSAVVEEQIRFPSSALFADIGWAALHSDLADRERVSVYFKSSRFGSFNHSHADQNSFVVFSGSEILAMDSGYYDFYNSPHWLGWYKQTKAHNAITIDDGRGQSLGRDGTGTIGSSGRIVQFVQNTDFDLVTGDASVAYGDTITKAERTLIFIRPSTIVIVDKLAATDPKQWEWNIHTPTPLLLQGQSYRSDSGRGDMCLDVAAPDPIGVSSGQGYPIPPASGVVVGPHYATRFGYKRPRKAGSFISVLRVHCGGVAPIIVSEHGMSSVTIAAHVISISEQGIFISPSQQH
jgi:hypothetical protein